MLNKMEIKALAEQGYGEECESAQLLLPRLVKPYGISDEEIEKDNHEITCFCYGKETEHCLLN
jgi:hypothetical protein